MNNEIETRFTRDYGVKYPIALAPMAFVGTAPDLAIAVCKAGGVGSLAVGPLPAAAVRGLIKAVKAATDGPLNVNFITILANDAQIRGMCRRECLSRVLPLGSSATGICRPVTRCRHQGLGTGGLSRCRQGGC